GHVPMEGAYLARVRGNGVIGEKASDDLRQPTPLHGDRLVHAPPQLLLDFLELRSHAVTPGMALQLEPTAARAPGYVGKAQEVEGLRFAEATLGASVRREASKLGEARLLRIER